MNANRRFRLASLILFVTLLLTPLPKSMAATVNTPPGNPTSPAYRPGTVLVAFTPGVASAQSRDVVQRYNATRVTTLPGLGVEVLRVAEGQELAISAALSAEPTIRYAEPDYRYHAFFTPNDEHYPKQWGHTRIRSAAAWDTTTGGADVTIAIVDTGVDLNHPDLVGKLLPGQSFLNLGQADSNPKDLNGHGTHVAGIAAASTNNTIGVAGMAWGARIMPIRVLETDGSGYTSDIALGVQWAWQNGANIINLSLGGTEYSQSLQNAINSAHSSGALIIAAMGNCRTAGGNCTEANPDNYPAAMNNVMAVAATGPSDTYAYYSQYGSHADIAAPGGAIVFQLADGIYSTMPTYDVDLTLNWGHTKNYDYLQGTSQATPLVSGLAALIWSVNPTLTPDEVQNLIELAAYDLGDKGWDETYGHGRIDAGAAVSAAVVLGTPALEPIDNPGGSENYWVRWSGVTYATGYTVEEDDNPAFSSPFLRYNNGPNTEVYVTGKEPGTWYYRVRANNASTSSAWSLTRSVTVAPDAPQMQALTNTGEPDAYRISWSSATSAAGYRLEEDSTGTFASPTVRYEGSATAYDVTGQPNGTWYYRVLAYNQGGDSSWSSQVLTTVTTTPVPAPPLGTIDNADGDRDYTVMWTAVPTATGYILEESASTYFESPTAITIQGGSTTTYDVQDQPSGTWHYRVRAMTPAGKSPWASARSVVVPAYAYLPLVFRNYTPPPIPSVVHNGDFEMGNSDWTESASGTYPLIVDNDYIKHHSDNDIEAHGGTWLAWLGGDTNVTHYIEQDVFISADEPYLTYWFSIGSKENVCTNDLGMVLVDGILEETITLCSDTNTTWADHNIDLSDHAAQVVTLRFQVVTNGSDNSNLFLDDIDFTTAPAVRMRQKALATTTNTGPRRH